MHIEMLHNGWVMPALSSPLVTADNIDRIRAKALWCPRKEDVTEKALCPRPPPKDQLVAAIGDQVHIQRQRSF